MKTITIKAEDCTTFTVEVLKLLYANGYHVDNVHEALTCLGGIIEALSFIEVSSIDEEEEWQN